MVRLEAPEAMCNCSPGGYLTGENDRQYRSAAHLERQAEQVCHSLLMPATLLSTVTLASAGRVGGHDDQGLVWAKALLCDCA